MNGGSTLDLQEQIPHYLLSEPFAKTTAPQNASYGLNFERKSTRSTPELVELEGDRESSHYRIVTYVRMHRLGFERVHPQYCQEFDGFRMVVPFEVDAYLDVGAAPSTTRSDNPATGRTVKKYNPPSGSPSKPLDNDHQSGTA